MKGQTMVIASYLAVMVMVILLFVEFIYILPETLTRREYSATSVDVYGLIDSRGNWTARDLLNALVDRYNPDYVNVSITVYNILNNDMILYRDYASYRALNVTIDELNIHRYAYTKLYRNGYYVEYLVEVGFK